MQTMKSLAAIAACGLMLGLAPQQSRKMFIEGRVVDAAGEPVSDVTIGAKWIVRDGALQATGKTMESGTDGVFDGKLALRGKSALLVAYDAERKHAGFAKFTKGQDDAVAIQLQPVVDFDVRFACSEMDLKGCNGMFSLKLDGESFLRNVRVEGGLRLPLPPGSYAWQAYDSYFSQSEGKFALELGAEKATEIVDFPATFIAKNIGKVVPDWTVSQSRNAKVELPQLSDYRGKWTLVEFWGYW